MPKSRVIRVRISQAEFQKLRAVKGDRNMSLAVRELIAKGYDVEEGQVRETAALLTKLENADISRIVARLEEIALSLSAQNELVLKYLKRILGEAMKGATLTEEFARRRLSRSDFFEELMQAVERRIGEKTESKR